MSLIKPTGLTGDQKFEYVPIKVTAGILLHIGAGIYNSVAGAIKELVSNSFDADAKNVIISTNYPYFDEIRVSDDGIGMSSVRLRQAMQTIGSSLKGTIEEIRISKKFGRPIIGHLGIGLMALSQVCSKAKIESQEEGVDVKFVAELNFSEFKQKEREQIEIAKLEILRDKYGGIEVMKDKLDYPNLDLDERAEIEEVYKLAVQADKLLDSKPDHGGEQLGYCILYPELPAIAEEHGTTITLSDIDQGVKDTLRDIGRPRDVLPSKYREKDTAWDDYREEVNSWSWLELTQRLNRKTNQTSFQSLPKYHQFLWELAAFVPVNYFDDGPVFINKDILGEKKLQLGRYSFSLRVDDRQLHKPILLPSGALSELETLREGLDYLIRVVNSDDIVGGEPLKYQGYLYWQRQQNEPSTIRGVRIYIRNVGIGPYDQTLMSFSTVNPTSRAGQITGEIYVEDGLERALSVDRNSFKETDAHYIALQQHIWRLLGSTYRENGILGLSVDSYYKRKEISDRAKKSLQLSELKANVNAAARNRVSVIVTDDMNEKPYKATRNRITVYENSPAWPRSIDEKYLYQRIIIPIRAAVLVGATAEEIVDFLESLLLKSNK